MQMVPWLPNTCTYQTDARLWIYFALDLTVVIVRCWDFTPLKMWNLLGQTESRYVTDIIYQHPTIFLSVSRKQQFLAPKCKYLSLIIPCPLMTTDQWPGKNMIHSNLMNTFWAKTKPNQLKQWIVKVDAKRKYMLIFISYGYNYIMIMIYVYDCNQTVTKLGVMRITPNIQDTDVYRDHIF